MEDMEFKPEKFSRRSEAVAWGSAVLVNLVWILLLVFDQPVSYWLLVLGIPLLLVAIGISLANWMDRRTIIRVDAGGIYFTNGLRTVNLNWDQINEIRVLPAQWGEKVQVFGPRTYFGFYTLGEVKSNGRVLGSTGFVDGDLIVKLILEKSGLTEGKQVDMGDQQEGYYYFRQ